MLLGLESGHRCQYDTNSRLPHPHLFLYTHGYRSQQPDTMGLVETVAENISFRSVVGFACAALVFNYVVGRLNEHIRIKRLGNYGRQIKSRAPFGASYPQPQVPPFVSDQG